MPRNTRTKQTKKRTSSLSIPAIIAVYWLHLIFLFSLVTFGITRVVQLSFYAQNCMTQTHVQSDSRCLYVYGDTVYEKGSRARPHHGNPCGSDVTRILPSSHGRNIAKYLDPNVVGSVCSTVVPTQLPTQKPAPTNTQPPPNPTNTPNPPTPTTVPQPTGIPTQKPNPPSTILSTPIESTRVVIPIPTTTFSNDTPIPTVRETPFFSDNEKSGFGKYLATSETSPDSVPEPSSSAPLYQVPEKTPGNFLSALSKYSATAAVLSFVLLIGTSLIGLGKKLLFPKKNRYI